MRYNLSLSIFLIVTLFHIPSFAQSGKKRVEPGKMYNSLDTLYAPSFGFTSQVPGGWVGALPRESEVFLLTSGNGSFGEIYVFGRETTDLQQLSDLWVEGVEITDNLKLKAISPKISDQTLQSEVVADGNYVRRQSRAFAATKCGNQGACITVLAVGKADDFQYVAGVALEFLQKGTFEVPSFESPYENFDWKEFLSNKMLISYNEVIGGARQTQITLCEDGTFAANVKKRGILKNINPEYRNNMSGNWTVVGEGPEAILNLTFTKKGLSPLTVPLSLKEEELFVEDERYYASGATGCKN